MSIKVILKILISTIIWVLALFIFAYPLLIEALFNTTKNFVEIYYASQCEWVSLFSNIGFLLLAVYDYFLGKKRDLYIWVFICIFLSMGCIFLIRCISFLEITNRLDDYLILSYDNFCFFVHGVFLLNLAVVKFLTLKETLFVDKEVNGVSRLK